MLHTVWSLYDPSAPTVLVDPDEFPETPRFEIRDDGDAVVDGYDNLTYTARRGLGVFAFDLPIPLGDALPEGTYTIQCKLATRNGQAVVTGAVPAFTVIEPATAEAYSAVRPYASADELHSVIGVSPKPAESEIIFAQQLMDDWMHRSLWPSVVERERKHLPPDRNLFTLAIRPIIRIAAAGASTPVDGQSVVGRYGYGRRDRRVLNQTSGNYLSVMAVLGSPPRFIPIDPAQIEFHPDTGECWIPTGFFLVNYSEVEVTYEAGYRVIPFSAKVALAETISWVRVKGFGPLTSFNIGRVSHSTGEELLTGEVKRRLEPYRAKFYA